MAAIEKIVQKWADEFKKGIAWLIVWKTGRSWNAKAVWLNCDNSAFKPEDLELVRKVLEQDPNAVMLNSRCCKFINKNMNVAALAAGIKYYYKNSKYYKNFLLMTRLVQYKTNELLARVVERFQFHSEKTKSDSPLVAETAKKMCEVEIWEMWALTQS